MSRVAQSANDVTNSLNGHEELEITHTFGWPIGYLLSNDKALFRRALIYTLERRDGINNERAAYATAMDLKLKDVIDYFADDSAEDDEAEGADESGKGEQQSEQLSETPAEPRPEELPASSPPSV